MSRVAIVLALLVCGVAQAHTLTVERTAVTDDVWRYTYTLPVGDGPNARIAVHRVVRERAPWWPRATPAAVLFMHGDASSFTASFTPLASFLAQRDIDVWGVDARWAIAPADADLSDFAAMTAAQRVADTQLALAFARATRFVTGSGAGPLVLSGFSSGAHLAYLVASADAARPAWQRSVAALAAIDSWAAIDPANLDALANACFGRDLMRADFEAGLVDSNNFFQIELGTLALTDPDGPSPNPRFTNLGRMRNFVGRTWLFFAPVPWYHLAAGVLVDGTVTALRETPDATVAAWLAGAAPHQSFREALDLMELLCADGPPPLDAPLARIDVPLLLLGAAGGYGDEARYTTTQVASSDVSTLIVGRFGREAIVEDFGHLDLLFATDAPSLAWTPLATWINLH